MTLVEFDRRVTPLVGLVCGYEAAAIASRGRVPTVSAMVWRVGETRRGRRAAVVGYAATVVWSWLHLFRRSG